MHVRGALHVHSTLSHDGTLTVPELAWWYQEHGYHFVALGDHFQDLDETSIDALVEQCREHSSANFCMIPGIEFACRGGWHIVAIGVTARLRQLEPLEIIEAIHEHDGYAVLAHPKRNRWNCPAELVRNVDAAEIWNVAYDGKFLTSAQSLVGFHKAREQNPSLLAVAGHDFHRKAGFYDVAIEMEVGSLTRAVILQKLRQGRYRIGSRLFRCNSAADFTTLELAGWRLLSWPIGGLRAIRDLLLH